MGKIQRSNKLKLDMGLFSRTFYYEDIIKTGFDFPKMFIALIESDNHINPEKKTITQ